MNLIPKICELLGVEIGERFKVKGRDDVYKFSEHRVFIECSSGNWLTMSGEIIRELLVGDLVIEKIPFEPKDGEDVWMVNFYEESNVFTVRTTWHDTMIGYAIKQSGNCFRTQDEAEKHKYEIYERLTGRKWEEKCDS